MGVRNSFGLGDRNLCVLQHRFYLKRDPFFWPAHGIGFVYQVVGCNAPGVLEDSFDLNLKHSAGQVFVFATRLRSALHVEPEIVERELRR